MTVSGPWILTILKLYLETLLRFMTTCHTDYKLVHKPRAMIDAATKPNNPGRNISPALVGEALALAAPVDVPEGTREEVLVLEAVEAVAVQLTKGHIKSVAGTSVE
jgi:hypothetical protein